MPPMTPRRSSLSDLRRSLAWGGHNNPTYAAMIASVDESVGRIMRTLDELKLADKTVLIFASDNGGVGGYVRGRCQAGRRYY